MHPSTFVVAFELCISTSTSTPDYTTMDVNPAPNGDAGPSTTSASPFAGLTLAVDSYTLDVAAGKRRLKQIEEDGSLTFEEP